MITNPFLILLILTSVIFTVKFISGLELSKPVFRYLPAPLWCYFLPTLLSSAGFIPYDAPLYGIISRFVLPACLILLLIGTHIPSIIQLGEKSLLAMAAGSAGIFAGAVISFALIFRLRSAHDPLAPEFWKGWGCLSASWTGGSANMIAVREILNANENLFSNLIVTDATIAYSWMAILVFLSQYQESINRFLGADESMIAGKEISEDALQALQSKKENAFEAASRISILLVFGFSLGYACWVFSGVLPSWGTMLNRFSWTIIFATFLPLALSATRARNIERLGAEKTGTFLLYILLTSVGARANLSSLSSAPYFIAFGFVCVSIHGLILLASGKLFKIPVSLLAAASQANVGGTISAPLVAGIYRKDLAPVGVILAVLGNIYGTYFGLFTAKICRIISYLIK